MSTEPRTTAVDWRASLAAAEGLPVDGGNSRGPVATRRRLWAALALACACAAATDARAQPADRRVEVWLVAGGAGLGAGTIAHDAGPLLLAGFQGDGRLIAELPLEARTQPVVEAGAGWWPHRRIGLQAWVAHDDAMARMPAAIVHSTLDYVARFPTGAPRDVHYEADTTWPGLNARTSRWILGANGAVRWPSAGRVSAAMSGGLCRLRVAGRAEPLPLQAFWLGGHEVLFGELLPLAARLGPVWAWRANAGAALDVRLGGHAALTATVRAVGGRAVTLPIAAQHAGPAPGGFDLPPLDALQALVQQSHATVPAASLRMMVGVRIVG